MELIYSTDAITINNHGLVTGQKVVHTASNPCGGLSSDGSYIMLLRLMIIQ